ncbi:hypothetical protein [Streptomyces sp. NPDC052114]|uniref:hypothetical protein n=1 Tax=unclassified Streptomyces TaxID=2593676 RepID=UPI00343CFC26
MPDDMHEEALALIDDAVASVQTGSGARMVVDAVLRGRCWIVYAALGGLFVVLDVGRAG